MLRKLFVITLILAAIFKQNSTAQTVSQVAFSKPPKLVVGIVIEEMRYEMLLRYWDSFGENGFKKIINEGAFCTQAHHNYLITQNGPGQASIVTGSYPSAILGY